MGETIVRAATSKDVDAIVSLHHAFYADHLAMDPAVWTTATPPADVYAAWLAELVADARAGVALVAAAPGGRLAGYLIAEHEPESARHWSPACVYFHDLYVAPADRRAGLARALVAGLIAWRDHQHANLPIRLTTAAPNEPARRFFATLGFRVATVEMLRA